MNKTVFFNRRISVQSFTFQPLENLHADKKYPFIGVNLYKLKFTPW